MKTITIKSEVQLNELLLDKVYGQIKRSIHKDKQANVCVIMGYPVTIKACKDSIVATIRKKLVYKI